MATRTVGAGDCIRPYRTAKGSPRIFHAPEGAAQTFKKGYPLIFDTTGGSENRVTVAGSDPAYIVGYAAEDASGVTGRDITIYAADPDTEFVGVVQNTGTLAHTNVGTKYGIVADAGNSIWRVDLTETTAAAVHAEITELIDPVGTVNGRVAFKPVAFDATGIASLSKPFGL
jgi:hypothetical protein